MQLKDEVTSNKMATADIDIAAAQTAACEQGEDTATRTNEFRTREAADEIKMTLEDVADVASMSAVLALNAFSGQPLRVSGGWQLE